MKTSDFEKRLQQQPLRPVPPEWRSEILSAVEAAQAKPKTEQWERKNQGRLARWFRELLWPCPQAWAGLAAVWVVLAAVNFVSGDTAASETPRPSAAISQTTLLAWHEKQRLLAELAGTASECPGETAAEPPKPAFVPRPRSEQEHGWRVC